MVVLLVVVVVVVEVVLVMLDVVVVVGVAVDVEVVLVVVVVVDAKPIWSAEMGQAPRESAAPNVQSPRQSTFLGPLHPCLRLHATLQFMQRAMEAS